MSMMMKKHVYLLAAILLNGLVGQKALAQSKIKDGSVTGTSAFPNANAVLDLESNKRGVLFPRLALTSTTSPAPLTLFVQGMVVYNTATAGTPPTDVSPGFYFSDGTSWQPFAFGSAGVVTAPNAPMMYYNGYKRFVAFNSDSVTEGITNLYFTPARARAVLNLSTSGNNGAATYDPASGSLNVPNYTLSGLGGEPNIAASSTANQYWNGYKQFVTLNSDSVAEGATNQYYTVVRARNAINLTTTGAGAATYDAATGVLNIPNGAAAITAPNTPNQYWNGYKQFVTLNSDSVAEGATNQYYTVVRARNAINLTTTGNNGAATYNATTGALNVPTYTLTGLGGEPTVPASSTANQYWNGYKQFVTLNSDSVAEGTNNKFYTDTRARNSLNLTTTGAGAATYDATTGVLNIPTGAAAITSSNTPNQYWNGYKQFVTLNSDSVAEGTTNKFYTDTRARNSLNLTTTGAGAATYDATTGVLNIPTGAAAITSSNTPNQYWNGYKQFVTLNSDSVAEGTTNKFYTDTRARNSIALSTTGNSGAATYDATTGALNVPAYTLTGLGGEPTVPASSTANQYWNGYKQFVTLNSDSVAEGTTNKFYTDTRARNSLNLTTTGAGAATYDAATGVLNIPNGAAAITAPNTPNQYWNGYKQFVTLNSDSVAEGTTNKFYTDTRARNSIALSTTGNSGAATYDATTGALNVPTYTLTGLGGEPTVPASSTANQYWNGYKQFVTLNSDSVAEGTNNKFYTDTRARNSLNLTTTGAGAATYDATTGVLNIPTGAAAITSSNTPNQYWNGFKQFVTLNSDSVAEGATNKFYTDTRARNSLNLTTTGAGAATYDATTGVLNIPTGAAAITSSNTPNQYWNGYKQFVTLNSDSVAEGTTNKFYTDTRARNSIALSTTGNSGAATYDATTGALNVPTYTLTGLGGEPTVPASSTANQYWNGYKQFVTLNSDSVAEGTTNKFYTDTRARNSLNLTTTGAGAATYDATTGVLNIPTGAAAITSSNTPNQYWNGYKQFVTLNSDSVAEGATNKFYTDSRARNSIAFSTTGNNGAATYDATTGALNVPTYTLTGLGGEPTVPASSTANQYWNGYKQFVTLNSDSVAEGTNNKFYTDTRARNSLNLTTTGAGAATYDATTGVLNIPTGAAAITSSNTPNQYWNGYKQFVTLNSDSVAEGTNNKFYTDTRARNSIALSTTGNSGAATYNTGTGALNVPTYTLTGLGGEPSVTASNTAKQYYNGYKQFVTFNSDSVTEGLTNQY